MCELLLDTDVLIKLAAYGLLEAIAHPGCDPGCERRTGLIAAARFVARKQLQRKAANVEGALANLDAFLTTAEILEPSQTELEFAADLEDAAARAGVDLDVGESQLCALALLQQRPVILTGDKRAIVAAEHLLGVVPAVAGLATRMACLEQAVTLAVQRIGSLVVRALVITELKMDTAVTICFHSTNPAVGDDFQPTGLASYVNDLRRSAPTMLLPGTALTLASVP